MQESQIIIIIANIVIGIIGFLIKKSINDLNASIQKLNEKVEELSEWRNKSGYRLETKLDEYIRRHTRLVKKVSELERFVIERRLRDEIK